MDNVYDYVYAYHTVKGENGIVRADDYKEALERVEDFTGCEVKSIVRLDELDGDSGVIREEYINANMNDADNYRNDIIGIGIDVEDTGIIDLEEEIRYALASSGIKVIGVAFQARWTASGYKKGVTI